MWSKNESLYVKTVRSPLIPLMNIKRMLFMGCFQTKV